MLPVQLRQFREKKTMHLNHFPFRTTELLNFSLNHNRIVFLAVLKPLLPSECKYMSCFEKNAQNPTASHHKRKIAWHSKKKRDLRQIPLHISEADVASHLQEDRADSPSVW